MSAAPAGKVELLAIAVASGSTVRAWAEENGVPLRTAHRWAGTATFKARVRSLRDELVSQALGRLVDSSTSAVDVLRSLMLAGDDERTRLQAAKAILATMLDVRAATELTQRVAELEASQHAQKPR